MNDMKKGIQYAFQTSNNMTLAMSGSGHTAMECAVFNIVEPGESVLVAINGIWGERVAEIAERMGMNLIIMSSHCLVLYRLMRAHFKHLSFHRCKGSHLGKNTRRTFYKCRN